MDCGAFDSGLCIHPDGLASPCCIFEREHFKRLDELDPTDPWQELRDGRGCAECKHAGVTYRDSFERFKNPVYAVRHLDVRNTNLCNLECTICNSYYSSRWAERLGEESKIITTDFDVDLTAVEYIYFAGGEPLLNPKHWKLLDSVPDPSKVTLQYNTNLTSVKRIDQYWPKFKRVLVNASMDAAYSLGTYLRYGTDWNTWVENVDHAAQYSEITINPTISALNVFNLKTIERWSKYPVEYNILTNPQHLCVSVLPQSLKDTIEYIPDNAQLHELLQRDDSWLFPHTMSFVLLQDKLKGTYIWNCLPFEKYAIEKYMKNE